MTPSVSDQRKGLPAPSEPAPKLIAATPAANRRHTRPAPGQPPAKVEYSRCVAITQLQVYEVRRRIETPKAVTEPYSFE